MIKKVLAFALLLGGGFFILNVVVEGDLLPGASTSAREVDPTEITEESGGIGVEGQAQSRLNLQVVVSGSLQIPSYREDVQPDGRILRRKLYELHAEDSVQLSEDRYRLEHVRVDLFESKSDSASPASGNKKTGELRARRAFLQIGRDKKGAPSIQEDKDIELVEAVLETGSNSRLNALKLEIERALVRWGDETIHLRTSTPRQRFQLTTLGRTEMTLTGRGLDAELPSDREKTGVPTRIRINSEPVLVHVDGQARTVLRSRGVLDYVEDGAIGQAVVTTREDVSIEGLQREAVDRPMRAFGDELRAVMWRGKGNGRSGLVWQRIRLTGAPARLDVEGYELSCSRLDVIPTPNGDPYLFTATGNPQLTTENDGEKLEFTAEQRIHVVQLREHLPRMLAPFGFARGGLGSSLRELIVFEGRSVAVTSGLELHAEDGLRVLGALRERGAMTVIGNGAVTVRSLDPADDLDVRGNRGVVVRRDLHGDEYIRLGPREVDAEHHFVVRRGALDVAGHGGCEVWRPAATTEPGRIVLASPESDIRITLAGSDGDLRGARSLEAAFDAQGLRRFEAEGDALEIDWRDENERIHGRATRIVSTARDVYDLFGAPARLDRDTSLTIDGNRLRIARTGARDALIQAFDEAHLSAKREGEAGTLELFADRLTVLPGVVPPGALDLFAPSLARIGMLAPTTRTRHLFAHGAVRIETMDGTDNRSDARGTHLMLQLADRSAAGLLTGAPASVERTGDGQDLSGRAPILRLRRHGGIETFALEPTAQGSPRVTLAQRDARFARTGDASLPVRVECDGPVIGGIDAVRFAGTVHAYAVDAAGVAQPGEFDLRADGMRMERAPESGAIVAVHAFGDAQLGWHDLDVKAQDLWLDLVNHLCTVRDERGNARFGVAGRGQWRGVQAEFDYVTLEVARVWRSRIVDHVEGEPDR